MKTNQELIEKYRIETTENQIIISSKENVIKKIISLLITHPNSFKNISINPQKFEIDTLTINLNFKADVDKFLSINDIRQELEKYFEA